MRGWIAIVALALSGCVSVPERDAGPPPCSWGGGVCLAPYAVPVCGDAWRITCDLPERRAYATHGCPEYGDGGEPRCADGSPIACRSADPTWCGNVVAHGPGYVGD